MTFVFSNSCTCSNFAKKKYRIFKTVFGACSQILVSTLSYVSWFSSFFLMLFINFLDVCYCCQLNLCSSRLLTVLHDLTTGFMNRDRWSGSRNFLQKRALEALYLVICKSGWTNYVVKRSKRLLLNEVSWFRLPWPIQ